MKKLLSVILAVVMVLSLATVAFAAGEAKFTKNYTVNAVQENAPVPAETLTFVSVPATTNPTQQNITINKVDITSTANDVVVDLPDYKKVGKYNYTVTETKGTAQGVTYSEASFGVQVLVTWNADHTDFVTEVSFTTGEEGAKVDSFTNIYDLGDLKIKKTISGNLADATVEFEIKVTLTTEEGKYVTTPITVAGAEDNAQTIAGGWTGSKEIVVKLHADEEVTFQNVPAGVTYAIEEDAKHLAGENFDPNSAKDTGYTVTYDNQKTGNIVSETQASTVVNNGKNTSVDTGITLDSIPFVLMLVVCAGAAVLFVTKRRTVEF